MEHVLALIPRRYHDKAKAVAALLGLIASAIVVAVPTLPPWAPVAVAVLTALGVYAVPAPGYHYERQTRGRHRA